MSRRRNLAELVLVDLLTNFRGLALLVALVLISAMAVIWNAHQFREANAQLAKEAKQARHLDVEWRQLRLEHRALADHARIEQLARKKLGMRPVGPDDETVVP